MRPGIIRLVDLFSEGSGHLGERIPNTFGSMLQFSLGKGMLGEKQTSATFNLAQVDQVFCDQRRASALAVRDGGGRGCTRKITSGPFLTSQQSVYTGNLLEEKVEIACFPEFAGADGRGV